MLKTDLTVFETRPMIQKTYVFKAYCGSDPCMDKAKKVTEWGALKHVDKKTDWCPECKYALYWHREAK